jgi:hypothetical protein
MTRHQNCQIRHRQRKQQVRFVQRLSRLFSFPDLICFPPHTLTHFATDECVLLEVSAIEIQARALADVSLVMMDMSPLNTRERISHNEDLDSSRNLSPGK